MIPNDFRPFSQPPEDVADILECHQLAYEFCQEIDRREAFENYCQWYYETARKHQEELKQMENDLNILGWFRRR